MDTKEPTDPYLELTRLSEAPSDDSHTSAVARWQSFYEKPVRTRLRDATHDRYQAKTRASR